MKRYYSDYVRHCMRFYLRNPDVIKISKVEELNIKACDEVFSKHDKINQDILKEIYCHRAPFEISVETIAMKFKVNPARVWRIIADLELQIATRRGLV